MTGEGRRHARRRVGSVGVLAALLLLVAGCSSGAKAAPHPTVQDAGTASVLVGAGPGESCHPASAASTPSEPTVTMPKVAPHLLVVHDIRLGKGAEAHLDQRITVQYVGVACSTGTQIDATWDRGEPYTTKLASPVIRGWLLGIPGMRVGGLRQLEIPPVLGYGSTGYKKAVRPGETLVYVIELLAVH